LISGNFQLIWLAIEAQAVDWLEVLLLSIFLVSCSDEGKLNVRVQVGAQVLERELELLDALSLLHGERNELGACIFIVELLHALNARVVEVTQEEHLKLARHWLESSVQRRVRDVLLDGLRARVGIVSHLDVDERNYSGLETVLWSFHYDDKFLLHLWTDFDGKTFLQLLRNWILNKPTIELDLRILDESSILVREGKLIPIVLSENGITSIALVLRYVHSHDLIFFADIAEQKC